MTNKFCLYFWPFRIFLVFGYFFWLSLHCPDLAALVQCRSKQRRQQQTTDHRMSDSMRDANANANANANASGQHPVISMTKVVKKISSDSVCSRGRRELPPGVPRGDPARVPSKIRHAGRGMANKPMTSKIRNGGNRCNIE